MMIRSLKWKHQKERKQERRDSLDSSCKTPSDWKDQTKYDINNLLQDAIHRKVHQKFKKETIRNDCPLIEESSPIEEHIQQTKWKKVTTAEIKEKHQQTQSITWKKATNESIKGNEVISKSSDRKQSLELKNKSFRQK